MKPTPLAAATLYAMLTVVSGCSQAAPPADPPVLGALKSQGVTIAGEFKAAQGVRAFAGAVGDSPLAVYVLADGSALVGTRVGADGKVLDQDKLAELVGKPMNDKAWDQLSKARWVLDGKAEAPRVVYVFTDANCPYCHHFWESARPWVTSGKVQLRHILVGVIKEDSPGKAAAIMTASNPSAAFLQNERSQGNGGIKAMASVPHNIQQELQANEALMNSLGFRGTPGIVVREANGDLKKINGMPRADALKALLGPI